MKNPLLIFVGAGLANTLLAYRMREKNPSVPILLLEGNSGPRDDRTWSFYESDVPPAVWRWLSPLAARVWDGYDVRFPKYERSLVGSAYASLRGADLVEKCGLTKNVRWNTKVAAVKETEVTLSSGEKISARAVVDARGKGAPRPRAEGYQKFFGLQLRLKNAHGLKRPLVMDAAVPQRHGYRFLYLLPWDERRVLVEDTYYSDDAALDPTALRRGVEAYVRERGWEVEAVEGEESSALPIPFFPPNSLPGPFETGVASGLFHPVTGYSVPYAAAIAENWDPLSPHAAGELAHLRQELTKRHSFYYLLNRMLFLAAKPLERRQIFEKFYRLPEGLVQRFYAGRTNLLDQGLILSGKPPVAVAPALKAMMQKEVAR